MNWESVAIEEIPSPCYVIDCDILKHNLGLMQSRCNQLGLRPLLAVKGFPLALLFREIAPYLYGISASSLFEARLGKRMEKEVHIHAPAYRPDEIQEIFSLCDHVVFNSLAQRDRYQIPSLLAGKNISFGLRINPEYSEVTIDKYNPCLPLSRFGLTQEMLKNRDIAGIEGFHLHVMCDQGAETLARVVGVLIDKFGDYLKNLSWINLGGGHQLADADYRTDLLYGPMSKLVSDFGLDVYVEPCEAVVTSCGYLVSTVLDIVRNKQETAILDTSAICHMPDVLEMPYRPEIAFPSDGNHGSHSYRLTGISCLPGDIIGEYQMPSPLHIGDKIVFSDMGAYTFAKENYFNGINFPAIVLYTEQNGFQVMKKFDYSDYEERFL